MRSPLLVTKVVSKLRTRPACAALAVAHRRHHLARLGEVWIQARHVLAEHVVRRVAERLARAVVVERDRAVPIDGDDDVGRVFEQLLEVDRREDEERSRRAARDRHARPRVRGRSRRFALASWRSSACARRERLLLAELSAAACGRTSSCWSSFARKARDLVATGRFTAENLPELTYPLERRDGVRGRRAPAASDAARRRWSRSRRCSPVIARSSTWSDEAPTARAARTRPRRSRAARRASRRRPRAVAAALDRERAAQARQQRRRASRPSTVASSATPTGRAAGGITCGRELGERHQDEAPPVHLGVRDLERPLGRSRRRRRAGRRGR